MRVSLKNIANVIQGHTLKILLCTIFFIVISSIKSTAQIDRDTLHFHDVEITKHKINHQATVKLKEFDSATISQYKTSNLAELLSTNPSIFIKSYGSGLGTVSFRGTGASQTKIFWNDVPVGSSAGGVFDFTLIPVSILNKVDASYGNASLNKGMGGLGGSILLSDTVPRHAGAEAVYSLGSFGTQKGLGGVSYGNNFLSGTTKFYFGKEENNFEYHNLAKFNFPLETQKNASGELYGAMQQVAMHLGAKDLISGALWYQTYSRNIAQPMTSVNGRQWKNDSSTRAFLGYEHKFTNVDWFVKTAWTNEALHYRDYLSQIDEKNMVDKLFIKTQANITLPKNAYAETSIQYVDDKATSSGLVTPRTQQRMSAYASINQYLGSFNYLAMVREETVNGVFYPAAFNLSCQEDLISNKRLQIRISGGRNFNYPALYDLYWVPGGNPDLQPELAYTGEGGLKSIVNVFKNTRLISETTVYASDISNEIIWLPKDKGYYEAQNLKKVNTSGLEIAEELEYKKGNYLLDIRGAYTYTNSITKSQLSNYDLSEGKQLIYIPKQSMYSSLHAGYKVWFLLVEYTLTGSRYTTPDNVFALPAYNLVNASLSKTFAVKGFNFTLQLRARNIFDVEYQAIQWYPMPGRYLEAGINIRI